MDETSDIEREKDIQREENYRHRVTVILTIIGLWLALPATCGLIQTMVDTSSQLDMFSKNAAIIFRLISDLCLLGLYLVGFGILILVGFLGWMLFSAWDLAVDKTPVILRHPITQRIFNWFKSLLPKKKEVNADVEKK